jgi:imidazole glycerol-phosphate synthase subunit HisH
MISVGVIDYGVGNIGSICNIIHSIGYQSTSVKDPCDIGNYSHIILPGVGSFDNAMLTLTQGGWVDKLELFIDSGKPILGICLGMQLMTNLSDEGDLSGLGWIKGTVKSFNSAILDDSRVPHMGWNTVELKKKILAFGNSDEYRYYFVHSYFVACYEKSDILAQTNYGGVSFVSAFQRENILGVQFHPEKSHKFGKDFFKFFLEEFGN